MIMTRFMKSLSIIYTRSSICTLIFRLAKDLHITQSDEKKIREWRGKRVTLLLLFILFALESLW